MNARVDFHIHSCLSPCASLEMSPRAIVARAKEIGLDCIALSDHCCPENLPAFRDACNEVEMPHLYGIEATSAEEVHVLCLFDQLDLALAFGREVYASLQDFDNDPMRFGDQPIIDVNEVILDSAEKLLVGATDISFFDLVPMALDAGALCIPAHIDRPYYGAISHLGFLPDLPYDAIEVLELETAEKNNRWPAVQFSDSHSLDQVGRRCTEIDTDGFTVDALREAFLKLKN